MPPRKKTSKPTASTPIDAAIHGEKRKNIPTGELRDFVAASEGAPPNVAFPRQALYPRDPAADPQLVWRGKEQQDTDGLEVPSVPVYIQEKIEPRAIIENLRQSSQGSAEEPSLFADFDGLDFNELVEFYEHDANWSNRMVLGDSLLAMTSMADKENLREKVQMIYLDPPYGIKFGSNWQVSTRKREVKDSKATDATRQPEQIRAFRDTWQLGIHSYLAYLRDRLVVARELLNDSGSVFVQIGDQNAHLVRNLLDEVFGTENFVSQVVFTKTGGFSSARLDGVYDLVLWYAKDTKQLKYRQLYTPKVYGGPGSSGYTLLETSPGKHRSMTKEEKADPSLIPAGSRIFDGTPLMSSGESKTPPVPLIFQGKEYLPPRNNHWKTTAEGNQRLLDAGRIVALGNRVEYLRYFDDFPYTALDNIWLGMGQRGFAGETIYVVQTDTRVIERCLLMATDPGDLVLDPTCGSGTTAYVAEKWGRRWITTDTSRVALTLARTRLMAARLPHFLLADSPEGSRKLAELTGSAPESPTGRADIRKGFVYRQAPHITLDSIANNPDIKPGMSRDEITAAIARHAESEPLYDQPYGDNKRVRVAGPFTVESLAPHRVVDPDEERPEAETAGQSQSSDSYEQMILTNLRKAGVQNTVKGEKLSFETLDAFPGAWLQAAGEYLTSDGYTRKVAVHVGPQYGTVGPEHIKEAAKEALRGAGFDLLLVCGFAFDARAGEIAAEFKPDKPDQSNFAVRQAEFKMGRLPVLLVKMNPDLAMGEALLKNTGAGNLFMIFGEPDVDIRPAAEAGHVEVEIHAVDVFDPTTGQIRSHSTDDIACWFVDTNYNGESFFVRHAYFTGADDPYGSLRGALRTDIDASAWESLYRTVSRPFAKPSTGRIAVKVINHYGDEVLKVYDLK